MHTPHGQYFDANDPKFKCCCGLVHVKRGATRVAIVTVIALIGYLIRSIITFEGSNERVGNLVSGILGILLGGAMCACLLYGIYVERAVFLIPYLIMEGLWIITVIIGAIISFIGFVSDAEIAHDFVKSVVGHKYDMNDKTLSLILFIYFLVVLVFQTWYYWVVYKCYVFFRLQSAFYEVCNSAVGHRTQVSPGYGTQVTTITVPGHYLQQQQMA